MLAASIEADQLSNMLGRWSIGTTTLVDDLVAGLSMLIDTGLLPVGAALPPQRVLASALGVSRGTVTAAYSALEARGYLLSRQGSGSRVRSDRTQLHARAGGRLFSYTSAPPDVIDLSTGALPASKVAAEVLVAMSPAAVVPYLSTDGYFPGGLPVLRQAIAEQLTKDGLPTKPQEVLVTAGALQATWLTVTTLVGGGDLVLVEEPTYRGALEVMRELGAQIQGIPLTDGGVSPDHVDGAAGRHPKLLYCQTGIHNPTGQSMNPKARRQLAAVINNHRLLTIEDRCSADLTLAGPEVTPGLASMVDPDLILTIGTASKLFWGGIRVGWVRASEDRIKALGELLKSVQLACSVQDQLATVEMLRRTTEARAERRATLSQALNLAEAELGSAFPDWTWEPIRGGSGIWVDTGQDALALAERGKRHGVKLNAGPSFSPHGGQRTMIRLPVWHDAPLLRRALDLLQPRSH